MTEEYRGYTITIEQDQDPINPREYDNLGTMVCLHNRYDLGDEQSPNFDNADSWYTERAYYFNDKFDIRTDSEGCTKDYLGENDITQIEKWIDKNIVWLPLYLYDHSGITMNTTGFLCNFDSGCVGFIYSHRDTILQAFGDKNLTEELQKSRATDVLVSEVGSYDKYISGEIYSVNIDLNDEFIDSCCGYDDYEYAEAEAKRMVDFHIESKFASSDSPTPDNESCDNCIESEGMCEMMDIAKKLTGLMSKYENIVSAIKKSEDRYANGKKKAFTEVLRDLKELI